MNALRQRLSESIRAFRDVFRNAALRRLELGLAGSVVGEWSFAIALAVYAFDHGGATAVGVVGLIRLIPSAAFGPFAGIFGDRYPRARVMVVSDLLRTALVAAAAAVALAGGPAVAVYLISVLVSLVSRVFRPAQAALLPSLARSPEELTAANVASSTIESLGVFLGPAIGGLILAATSAGVVFLVTSAMFLWSASFVTFVHETREPRPEASQHGVGAAFAGFGVIGREPNLRVLVGLFGAQTLVAGALNVLIVVTALDLLGLGRSGVGFLNSAVGIGGVIGAAAALALVGRKRLAGDFGLGILLWGVPLAVIGLWPNPTVALILLGVLGVGNTIVDVAGFTLLQRAVADEVLARVMAVMETVFVATMGIGSVLAPLLISGLGIRASLIGTGALLPVLVALFWNRLRSMDRAAVVPTQRLALLRAVPIFAPLPAPTLEHLAAALAPVRFAAGETVFRQGDRGDRFYVIGDGEVAISVDGAAPKTERAGDYFGEIALLRDVPRTATVTAATDVELYALEREEFIAAVTGHAPSAAAADAVIGARLGTLRPGIASL